MKAMVLSAIFICSVVIAYAFGAQQAGGRQQTQRFPQLENEAVKVWRSRILPDQPLAMHRHEHPRVIVALQGGTINIVDDRGGKEEHVWETGKAYWLPANLPNQLHADVNAGKQPIEVMVVELEKEK